jgi:GAF domain-containing protein
VNDFSYEDDRVQRNVWSFKAFPLPDRSVGVVFEKVTEKKRAEQLIQNVAAGAGGRTGDAFFRSFATHLAKALDMEYASVGEVEADGKGIRTVAAYENGEIVDNFRYDLAGTPCGFVVEQRACCHPEKVADKFPEDHALREKGVECYVGAPLFDAEGAPLGLITVMGRRPLENPETALNVLRIFATRAAAELERKRTAGGQAAG